MATNYLDTGDTGRAVSAESDGALFAGIFGAEKYVLENGSQFKAEVQSNNIVKISDGDAVMYGRHVRIPANDSALVTINNGHSGTNRIDLIVFRYTKDSTGKETVDLVVIQGEDSTGTATAPTAVDGNILTGAMQSDFPLYSVELNGINIVKVNPLFNVIGNISKLKEELTELNSNLVKTAVYMNNGAYNIAPSNSEFQGTDFSKKILDNIGLVHNYDATNYKHTFTVPQDGIYLIHAYMNFQQGVAKQLSLYAKLERNNVEQSRQSKLIGPYSGADFMFLNEINAGDKIRFTVLQNSGSVISASGGCRLNIIRMGKWK